MSVFQRRKQTTEGHLYPYNLAYKPCMLLPRTVQYSEARDAAEACSLSQNTAQRCSPDLLAEESWEHLVHNSTSRPNTVPLRLWV